MKTAAFIFISVLATAFAANADNVHTDAKHGFKIQPLSGSTTNATNLDEPLRVEFMMPDNTNCNVVSIEDLATTGLTQAQINANVKNGYMKTATLDELHLTDPNGVVESTLITQNGMTGWQVEMTFTIPGEPPIAAKGYKDIFAVPGKLYHINCLARAEDFPSTKAAFKTMMQSFDVLK